MLKFPKFSLIFKLINLINFLKNNPQKQILGKRILVLAPHFDDEIFGCGGTLRKHVLAGDEIKIIYMTDGSNGIPQIKNKKKVFEIRKKESEQANRLIGINDFYYLMEPDRYKPINNGSIDKLSKIIIEFKPDLIFLPWFLDNHPDHKKTNYMLKEAIDNLNYNCNICAYEIWTPLIPNILVDISDVFDTKMKAMKCFKSQLKSIRYDLAFEGLNRYRSIHKQRGDGYAEAFIFIPSKKYFNFINKSFHWLTYD